MRAGTVAVVVTLLASGGVAGAAPSLVPEIYGVAIDTGQSIPSGDLAEQCAGGANGRTLVRFGVRVHNVGDAALVIGDPQCPDCPTHPGAICGNPEFECSPANGHNHPHFQDFARYELLDVAGNLVALGAKRGFCIRDDCPGTPVYDCSNQGISAGCYDDYAPNLGCQYIDATGVPDVTTRALRVRVILDPDQLLADANRSDNVVEVGIPGCGDGVVQGNEQCDGGACCDAHCRLVAANTPCRAARNACDLAESCDGTSADCPADVRRADGAPCGSGTPPCLTQTCQNGDCIAARTAAGCVAARTCVAPGAADPDDACRRCDGVAWTPYVAPDPLGLRCQMARVTGAVAAASCGPRVARAVGTRLTRAASLLARLNDADTVSRRLDTRLGRLVKSAARIVRQARRHGCPASALETELATLLAQMRAARPAATP